MFYSEREMPTGIRNSKPLNRPLAERRDETDRRSDLDNDAGDLLRSAIESSLKIAVPSWPLQNIVAVNPFWFMKDNRFDRVVSDLSCVLQQSLLMPTEYYLECFADKRIEEAALREVLQATKRHWSELPSSIESFIRLSQASASSGPRVQTVADVFGRNRNWSEVVRAELGKYAAAYFDDQQALARFPWQSGSFWTGWLMAQEYDKVLEKLGAGNFREALAPLKNLAPEAALAWMLERMGLSSQRSRVLYMQRLMASSLGWASRFKYFEWQKALGFSVDRPSGAVELLAVRMAYDFGLFRIEEARENESIREWQEQIEAASRRPESLNDTQLGCLLIWQKAFELTHQRQVAEKLGGGSLKRSSVPKYQMVFCLDVRSEVMRRHLELEEPSLQTLGFAGFFGVPISFQAIDAKKPESRLPALASPSIEIKESFESDAHHSTRASVRGDDLITSYFRNLRKAPLSSFLYVELFGILSIERILRKTAASLITRLQSGRVPSRFRLAKKETGDSPVCLTRGGPLSLSQKVQMAKSALLNMGLTKNFAELVLFVGHGSATTNNAFGSSLDCGACGGHSGDVNSRFLAELLNSPEVREGLAQLGVLIPEQTWFVAALHETVTDRIFLLDESSIPARLNGSLRHLKRLTERASCRASEERSQAVSAILDPDAMRRSQSWSEVRPEWGLTGNASFIVASRERSRGVDLQGRAFLHDYDWKSDEGFKTLELIMTAPMVVTNWINLQYYASTVAPSVYGAGSKTLHNLVNEVGVVEGNGGDLRIGLPIQSVHDGERFVHEPLRLSVFIEAPRQEIEAVIARHETVRQLVENEWLYILHIEPETLKVFRRERGGDYVALAENQERTA